MTTDEKIEILGKLRAAYKRLDGVEDKIDQKIAHEQSRRGEVASNRVHLLSEINRLKAEVRVELKNE